MTSIRSAAVLTPLCVLVVVIVGCASDDQDEAPRTTPTTSAATVGATAGDDGADTGAIAVSEALLLTCEGVGGGLSFETALSSCNEARERGQRLALETGAVGPGATGGELVFSIVCSAIQNDIPATGDAITIALAKALHEQRVCPGDLSMIVPE